MVAILSPWRSAKAMRSGSRAMVPSSFMISQITPAGLSPARRARSTAASVWPARTSTPPSLATSGNTWPGVMIVAIVLGRIDGDGDGVGAVMGRDAGRDPFPRLDRYGEGGGVPRAVGARHQLEMELLGAFGREREADQAAAMLGHEVDGVGRRHLRRDDQVALVLALLGVDQDEHAAVARILDHLLDRREKLMVAGLGHDGHGVSPSCSLKRAT